MIQFLHMRLNLVTMTIFSAMVADMIEADLLILLTDIDGLYDKDPKTNIDAKRISFVPEVTEQIHKMAGRKRF